MAPSDRVDPRISSPKKQSRSQGGHLIETSTCCTFIIADGTSSTRTSASATSTATAATVTVHCTDSAGTCVWTGLGALNGEDDGGVSDQEEEVELH